MPTLLIVEDGTEYHDFFRLFLKKDHTYHHAQAGQRALDILAAEEVELVVLDMRFDRTDPAELLGDVDEVANQYFGGDLARAERFVEENQGTMVLSAMRENEHHQPVLFVHDMAERKLDNLRKLYGKVYTVPNFDAAAIRKEIAAALGDEA